jgi:hypothetical protein
LLLLFGRKILCFQLYSVARMSTSQTAISEAQSFPMTALPSQDRAKDTEASPAERPQEPVIINREPSTPFLKLLTAGFSFFCAGVNDGTLGPFIPYIISSFHIGTGDVAIM